MAEVQRKTLPLHRQRFARLLMCSGIDREAVYMIGAALSSEEEVNLFVEKLKVFLDEHPEKMQLTNLEALEIFVQVIEALGTPMSD